MLTVDKLKDFGANVDEGLSRCANNEALYLRLVKMCVDEILSCPLGETLAEGNLDRAFEIAHKLKGGVGNLSLSPISVPVCKLTELLRGKIPGDYDALYGEIMKEAKKLASLMD